MKRTVLVFIIVALFSAPGFSQDSEGNYAIDFRFQPAALFDASAGALFSMPNLKLRYFKSDRMAYRLTVDLSFQNERSFFDPDEDDKVTFIFTDITISPGFEKQLGSDKLRLYYGADLPIGLRTYTRKTDVGGNVVVINNDNGNGAFSLGLRAVFGVDYYLMSGFYLGAEFNPGIYYWLYSDRKVDGEVVDRGPRYFGFNLSSSSGIRVGIRF